jgi:hypothetical protein
MAWCFVLVVVYSMGERDGSLGVMFGTLAVLFLGFCFLYCAKIPIYYVFFFFGSTKQTPSTPVLVGVHINTRLFDFNKLSAAQSGLMLV